LFISSNGGGGKISDYCEEEKIARGRDERKNMEYIFLCGRGEKAGSKGSSKIFKWTSSKNRQTEIVGRGRGGGTNHYKPGRFVRDNWYLDDTSDLRTKERKCPGPPRLIGKGDTGMNFSQATRPIYRVCIQGMKTLQKVFLSLSDILL